MLLNATAAFIWMRISSLKVAADYAQHFGVSLEQAEADVKSVQSAWTNWPPAPPLLVTSTGSLSKPQDNVVTLQVNNIRFLVRFLTTAAAEEALPRIGALRVRDDGSHDYSFVLSDHQQGTSISLDGKLLATEPLVTAARAILLQEIARLAEPGRDFTAILHAGAVGNSDGCIILAGASFSGKSTLCAALMQSGLLCYAEDSAVLTKEYKLAGMPFAISLREGSWPLFPHLDRPRFIPSNLNGASPAVLPVGMIFVKYDSEQETTTLEPVDTFEALLEIEKSGFWVEHTQSAISAFLEWLGHLPIYRLSYSDLQSAVAEVTNLLASHT